MSRNLGTARSNAAPEGPGSLALPTPAPVPAAGGAGRSVVLVGLMGAGKTSIGKRLAQRLGLPFKDADAEIEQAAGCTIAELFARYGEPAFRDGERRVVKRLLAGPPLVLATGGGAFMDQRTREAVREGGATSIWLRCPLPVLLRRVAGRTHRPLLNAGDPAEILTRLMRQRHPVYALADVVVDCADDPPEVTTGHVLDALLTWRAPRRLTVSVSSGQYDVLVGDGLLARAGAHLSNVLPQKRAVIVCDRRLEGTHLPTLRAGLAEGGIEADVILVDSGETAKSLDGFGRVVEGLLDLGVERRTAVVALGGGVIGDLAGFAAAATLRGLPFVQVPTTLLAQVDSSVGGKTGINTRHGKNLVGAFHQPLAVLADTGTLATLPVRELRAGYAEIVKAGLIGDAGLFAWCEENGARVVGGDAAVQAEAVLLACAFKARVVGEDERETAASDGRALLNLGHTFAHALEAEAHYDGSLLHGEAVSIGLDLAFRLSVRLRCCSPADLRRVVSHLDAVGMPTGAWLRERRFSAGRVVSHMRRDKKMRDGQLAFVLARGVGDAFTTRDVPEAAVVEVLREAGASA